MTEIGRSMGKALPNQDLFKSLGNSLSMATLHTIGSGSAIASARRQNTSLALAHDALVLIDCSGNPVAFLA
jgi:hypothetical protein